MHKRILLNIAMAGLLTGGAFGAEKRVKMESLPPAVQNTVREQSKGAIVRGLSKEVEHGETYYEAELTLNGQKRDVLMDAAGTVVEVEEEVTFASLPAPVRAAFEKQARNGKIESVESVTKDGKVTAYDAKVRTAGKAFEVSVSPQGVLLTE